MIHQNLIFNYALSEKTNDLLKLILAIINFVLTKGVWSINTKGLSSYSKYAYLMS